MNAAVVHSFGQAPRFEQFPEPVPGEGEVAVHVRAAALKPVDKQLVNGSHYGSKSRSLPFICGTDGAGILDDGSRVLFVMPGAPYGAMAERAVMKRMFCFPLPDDVDDGVAAAVFNPGLSAWASLAWRAKLQAGETILILGATGVTGRLAIQTAKLMGAGRVIAAGRNEESLRAAYGLGADATIRLGGTDRELRRELKEVLAGEKAVDIILDYLWGKPAEAAMDAVTGGDFTPTSNRVRFVQVGESAGPEITLRAAALRSSRLEILGAGSGSAPPLEMWLDAAKELLGRIARGELRIDTEQVTLADIEDAWGREQSGKRLVITP
jgi:NADPH:quinone reductase-like Zn-dependent oxidoreductase